MSKNQSKTIPPPLLVQLENLFEDITPAGPASAAIEIFTTKKPTYSVRDLIIFRKALLSHYSWKDVRSVVEGIGALPWN
jgi:hypothetical protein